jgi:hypothetical protein
VSGLWMPLALSQVGSRRVMAIRGQTKERESDMLALMLPMAVGTGVVVIVVAIVVALIVLFVTLSMRGRRKAKLRDQSRRDPR